ncbi:MAG: hypothetical protein WKF79_00360 [Nocardioides sp.]
MTFDPKRRLVMATFKTVLGHNLPAGTPLVIVGEEPAASGEVDEAMARRLHASGVATYVEDARPTPVETPEQERARLAHEALRDAPEGGDLDLLVSNDLQVWAADDSETGKKAGDRVTKADLLVIAEREGARVETDDNKPDLQRKIMLRRAEGFDANLTYADSVEGGIQRDGATGGSTAPGTHGEAYTAVGGDAHGSAGEGPAD